MTAKNCWRWLVVVPCAFLLLPACTTDVPESPPQSEKETPREQPRAGSQEEARSSVVSSALVTPEVVEEQAEPERSGGEAVTRRLRRGMFDNQEEQAEPERSGGEAVTRRLRRGMFDNQEEEAADRPGACTLYDIHVRGCSTWCWDPLCIKATCYCFPPSY
jgi:hypothetical protein